MVKNSTAWLPTAFYNDGKINNINKTVQLLFRVFMDNSIQRDMTALVKKQIEFLLKITYPCMVCF
jgi:hypothetical protein